MNETPVSVLCAQIHYYRSFIHRLKTRLGLDKETPQEKVDELILHSQEKIKEFEAAIHILDPNAKCEPRAERTPPDKFDLDAMAKAAAMIMMSNEGFKGNIRLDFGSAFDKSGK